MIEKNWHEVEGILLRKYPNFVLSDRAHYLDRIPAFVFHGVTGELLDPMLEFLSDNGYRTLTADEYMERLGRRERGREREVLLTFDDGHKSLYTVAYPVLKRFGFKAVAYVVPGMVPDGNDSNGGGTCKRNLCNWEQIREMHASGVIDFQSHSLYHQSIAISRRVVDFIRPDTDYSFLDSDLAPLVEEARSRTKADGPALGTPIHDWWSRYGEIPAFRESPSAVEACVEYVNRHGKASFFRKPGWRRRLKAVLEEARRSDPGPGFETEREQRRAVLRDLVDSKREIERRLPGKTVRHFAYPWFRGSPLAVELSPEAGYLSNAWGSLLPDFVHAQRAVLPVPRLPLWYIWRLPGKGRKSIGTALWSRWFSNSREREPRRAHLRMAAIPTSEKMTASISMPRILAQEYFSKPMNGLFRAFDLAAYDAVGLKFKRPALDLGCGNGAFGSVLCRVYGLDELDLGSDISQRNVRLAKQRGVHKVVFRADARALPIKKETTAFIICNGVLCCIDPGHDLALQEVARILKPGGQLVMTLPTPAFTSVLMPTRLLERIGLPRLAAIYSRKVNARNGHWKLEHLEGWQKELERAGLKIEDYVYYFGRTEATWWSVLAMRPFQAFGVLRWVPRFMQRIAVLATERLIRCVSGLGRQEGNQYGYVLIVARKT